MAYNDTMPVPDQLRPFTRSISLDHLMLHCYLGGSGGTPIVLVHGLGDEADTWQHIFPLLAAQRTTLTFDLPGFGRSDKPHRSYTIAFFARTVEALLDTLAFDTAILVGHSLGAAVAQRFALARPQRVERLVLIDGGLPIEPRTPAPPLWPFLTPGVGEYGYTSLRRSQDAAYETLRPFYADLDSLPEADRAFLRERVWARVWSNGQRRAFLSAFRWLSLDSWLRADSFRQRLAVLPTPTDLIWGTHDRLQPVATGNALAQLLPHGRFHVIANGGHNVQQEQPAAVAQIINTMW